MKKILIITPARVRESDLIETIRRVGCEVTLAPKTALPALDASGFDAVVISGGTESEPMTFTPAEREAADRLSRSGVRVFAEFCQYLGAVNCPNVESTRYARPVSRFRYGEIIEGDILDEQCNTRVVHFYASESRIPLLSYRANPEGFYTLKNYADAEFPVSADALWTEHDTLLFCTFRLADFAKARNQVQKSASDIAGAKPAAVPGFADTLRDSLTTVNDMQSQKSAMIQSFASGETQNVHELMITMQKAGLAVNLTAAVRNKVLEAYRELSKLQF